MSAGRIDRRTVSSTSESTTLNLPADAVTIRKSGIEFRSGKALAPWTEITLSIESPIEKKKVACRGVVVACEGNRHSGYQVSLLFVGMTPQTEHRLQSLALSDLR